MATKHPRIRIAKGARRTPFASIDEAIDAFEAAGHPLPVYVAHDLDADNLALLRAEKLSYVLHHSLEADAAHALGTLIEARGGAPKTKRPAHSALVIVTPFNIPA